MSSQVASSVAEPICLGEYTWKISDLAKSFPPRWQHPNKRVIADIAGNDTEQPGDITVSRWKQRGIPKRVTVCKHICPYAGFFTYERSQEDTSMHWHMNFADPHLFGYYGGPLLAEDELQVAEHPILASVSMVLSTTTRDTQQEGLSPSTRDQEGAATPVLVKGAPRRCAIDTSNIYGDNFSRASNEQVRQATTKITPPTISNILALAALEPHVGKYTVDQIRQLYCIAYTGFRSMVLFSKNHSVTLNTGHWGCGAFGGNKGLVAVVQLLAAGSAGVEHVVYWYGFTELDRSALQHGMDVAKALDGLEAEEVFYLLDSAGYSWGDANENNVPYVPPTNCLLQRQR